ncbi:hypothetical protein VTN02DRAFT_2357 [Thermoascus thermophilus]
MRTETLLRVSALLAALQTTHAAPTSTSGGNPPLRGSEDLLGYSASNTLTTEDTDAIKFQLVPGHKDDTIDGVYLDFEHAENPQPIRGDRGGTDPGPRNYYYDRINSDKLAPPGTDNGATINAQWPMGLSHNR